MGKMSQDQTLPNLDEKKSGPEHPPESSNQVKRDYNNSLYTYATLVETSDEEFESWYYFIRYQGNEEALAHLEKQLDSVEWYAFDKLSTFVIETQYLVSEKTAKEMTKIDINSQSFHRKFDGKLHTINLGFRDRHSTERKMEKAFDVLGYGQIENFIDEEDIDEEDLASHSESESSEPPASDSSSDEESIRPKRKVPLPPSMVRSNLPRHQRHPKKNRKNCKNHRR